MNNEPKERPEKEYYQHKTIECPNCESQLRIKQPLQELPQDKTFLADTSISARLKGWLKKEQQPLLNPDKPVLLLITEDKRLIAIPGVKPQLFTTKTGDKEKGIILTPEKLLSLPIGNQYIPCWVAYEDCPTPLPEDPIHSAEQFRNQIIAIATNRDTLNKPPENPIKGGVKWLFIAIGIGALLLLAGQSGLFEALLGQTTTVAPAVIQNMTNATNVTLPSVM